MREYRYRVDRDGRIFHDGSEIVDPAVLRFFLLAMQETEDRRYLVLCQGERNWFDADDTPFVIQRARCEASAGALVSVDLYLAGDYREALDPSTLEGGGEFLYCRVRRGAFRARFGRLAVHALAPYLVDGNEGIGLLFRGTRYPIRAVVG